MKEVKEVCEKGNESVGGVKEGRVNRKRREVENEEIKM
jgi:hypothetical protein